MAGSAKAGARPRATGFYLLQASLLFALALLLVAPPARGAMLVLPLAGATPAGLLGDAQLVGGGPLPGTLIVYGERARLLPHLIRHGAIAVATSVPACDGEPA